MIWIKSKIDPEGTILECIKYQKRVKVLRWRPTWHQHCRRTWKPRWRNLTELSDQSGKIFNKATHHHHEATSFSEETRYPDPIPEEFTIDKHSVTITPDFSQKTQLRQEEFWLLREKLHEQGLKTRLKDPAVLRIWIDDECKEFSDTHTTTEEIKRRFPSLFFLCSHGIEKMKETCRHAEEWLRTVSLSLRSFPPFFLSFYFPSLLISGWTLIGLLYDNVTVICIISLEKRSLLILNYAF